MAVTTTNNFFYHRTPNNSEFLSQNSLNSKCSQQGICTEVSNIFRLFYSIIFASFFIVEIRVIKLGITLNGYCGTHEKNNNCA